MTAAVGWLALSVSLVGLCLVARGVRSGWAARLVAGWLWLLFAFLNRQPVYMATSVLYTVIDAYGWLRRRRPKNGEKKGLIRIHGEPRGRINLWPEN